MMMTTTKMTASNNASNNTTTSTSTTATATTTSNLMTDNNNNYNTTSNSSNSRSSDLGMNRIEFVDYQDESRLGQVTLLIEQDLSEPYSVFTYRYFLERFPDLCILAIDAKTKEPIGCVVGKIDANVTTTTTTSTDAAAKAAADATDGDDDTAAAAAPPTATSTAGEDTDPSATTSTTATTNSTTTTINTGYIGMLAVSSSHRRRGIGKALVRQVLRRMKRRYNCTSATLETEVTNQGAQFLYQNHFGFVREDLLVRYYLNWNDAYRLRLWF